MKFIYSLLAAPAALAAPVLEAAFSSDVIPGSWIAVQKSDSTTESLGDSIAEILGSQPKRQSKIGSFRSFSLDAEDGPLLRQVAALNDIAYIEPDVEVRLNAMETQSDAEWGLARISSVEPGATDYVYDESAGEDTVAYIVDTGIYTEHSDFEGRAEFGVSFVDGEQEGDGNGHGTHCAGTVGGATYGVAKKTTLVAVKVLNARGSGSLSSIIAGIEWVVKDAEERGVVGRAVANLSLGSPRYASGGNAVNAAAAAAVDSGIFLSVAAGNEGTPASLSSPASEPSVCTVGATNENDMKATFSNYGSLIDVFAPGVGITSTWNNGTESTETLDGTSMAAPHITGLAAYFMRLESITDPVELCDYIKTMATNGTVSLAMSSNNLLAYNNAGGDGESLKF